MIRIAGSNNLQFPAGLQGPQGPAGTGAPGPAGTTPDFEIGTVTTLPTGSSATATITGTVANPVLNLGIPTGPQGPQGDPGAPGGGSSIPVPIGPYNGSNNIVLQKAIKYLSSTEIEPQALYFIESVLCGVVQIGGNKRYQVNIMKTMMVEGTAGDNDRYCQYTIDSPVTITGWVKIVCGEWDGSGVKMDMVINWSELTLGSTYSNANYKEGAIYCITAPIFAQPTGGGGVGIVGNPIEIIADNATVDGSKPIATVSMEMVGKAITLAAMADYYGPVTLKNDSDTFAFRVEATDGLKIDGVDAIYVEPGKYVTIYPDPVRNRFTAVGTHILTDPDA